MPLPNRLDDSFEIATPEQIELQFRLAGIGSRFLAIVVDTLWQGLVGIILAFTYFLFAVPLHLIGPQWMAAVMIVLFFVLYWGYFAIFEILWNGQTPGKRTAGIRVIKETGRSLTPVETIGRNLMRIVDQLPSFYAVGVISAALSKQGKRLGDFVAGSIVVHERSMREIQATWHQASASVTSAPVGGNRLSPDDIALIETFLVRRYDLAPDVRRHMAHQILNRLAPKLHVSDEDRAAVESTLEAVVHEHRS